MPPSSYYAGSLLLQHMRHARQQVEARQGFRTDPHDLERFYPATEEGAEQLIEDAIATAPTPSSHHPSPSSLGSEVLSIHKEDEALVDLLGADEIPLELGLIFLLPEIQHLYQAHQVARREAQSHSLEFTIEFPLETNSRERGNRYCTPTPYPHHRTRQRKVYVADKHKKRYEDSYDPDLDHHYNLYLRPRSYLRKLRKYPY